MKQKKSDEEDSQRKLARRKKTSPFTYMQANMCVCVRVCVPTYVCMSACMCVCVYVRLSVSDSMCVRVCGILAFFPTRPMKAWLAVYMMVGR